MVTDDTEPRGGLFLQVPGVQLPLELGAEPGLLFLHNRGQPRAIAAGGDLEAAVAEDRIYPKDIEQAFACFMASGNKQPAPKATSKRFPRDPKPALAVPSPSAPGAVRGDRRADRLRETSVKGRRRRASVNR